MKCTCDCCGFTQEFADGEAAYDAGWDALPYFTHYTSCPLCPMVCAAFGKPHTKAHALWAKEGRPKEFTVAKCADDDRFGGPELTKEELADVNKFLGQFEAIFKKGKQ